MCLFLEAEEHLPPQRLCKVSERWVTAHAYSTSLPVSQPLTLTNERATLSYSTCDTPRLFPNTYKTLHRAAALGRKKQTEKIPLRRSSLNIKRLLHGEKMQLSHSLQALGGKGLQADRSSCLSLFWTWKTADRWVSWELKDWLYRRSKNIGKTEASVILGRWGNMKPGSTLCTMLCYHMRKPRNCKPPRVHIFPGCSCCSRVSPTQGWLSPEGPRLSSFNMLPWNVLAVLSTTRLFLSLVSSSY